MVQFERSSSMFNKEKIFAEPQMELLVRFRSKGRNSTLIWCSVQFSSGSNHGSEPNFTITNPHIPLPHAPFLIPIFPFPMLPFINIWSPQSQRSGSNWGISLRAKAYNILYIM